MPTTLYLEAAGLLVRKVGRPEEEEDGIGGESGGERMMAGGIGRIVHRSRELHSWFNYGSELLYIHLINFIPSSSMSSEVVDKTSRVASARSMSSCSSVSGFLSQTKLVK